MSNQEIAEVFELLAKLLEIHGENSFKVKSYSSAAFRIEKLEREIDGMNDGEIRSIPGIGDSITKKIIEIQSTGVLSSLTELLDKTPQGVIELLSLKGIGPKKIGQLWVMLGIQSPDDLERACLDNKLITLKGFTTKTQEDILQKLSFRKSNEGFFLWAKASFFAEELFNILQETFPKDQLSFTGSYRRQMPVLDRVELVTTIEKSILKGFLLAHQYDVVTDIENELHTIKESTPKFIFHLTTTENFAATLFTTTGNATFTSSFSNMENATSEEEIFANNTCAFIPSPLRDNDWAIPLSKQNKLPKLIEETDVKGLIHCHSKWSDGKFTIEEMANAAINKGLEYMVISDHSQSAFYANGLTAERIAAQHKEIDALNKKLAPFKIFKSIEVDILPNGNLDYPDDVFKSLDIVITSIHSILNMTEAKAMDRLLTAVRNPATNILGHPTGRQLLVREGYPINHELLIKECIANNVVIEINANPRRLDLDWQWIHNALSQGAMLSINPDAHSTKGIDDIRYGVLAAQKGGLTKEKNLSSMSLIQFEEYIATNKKW